MQLFITWLALTEVNRSNRCLIMVLMASHLLTSRKVRETPQKLSNNNNRTLNTTMKSRKLMMTTYTCPRFLKLCLRTMKALLANINIKLLKKISSWSLNRTVMQKRLPWMPSTRITCNICKWEQLTTKTILMSQTGEAQIWLTP